MENMLKIIVRCKNHDQSHYWLSSMIQVNYDEFVSKYNVKESRSGYSHTLAFAKEVHLIHSHQKVKDMELA